MSANVIFRGPVSRQPRTVSDKTVAGAYSPGVLVLVGASTLALAAATDKEKTLHVLTNVDYQGQAVTTDYVSGDSGVAYYPEAGDTYQIRMAADTYAVGDNLSVAADGRLAKSVSGDRVFATFAGTAGAIAAGDLADAEIANSFVMA